MSIPLDNLRRFAVTRTFFTPATLKHALDTFGFVQADPIRSPARAQDLTLRHRVANYRAGDLERLYPRLNIEEDHFINYGFVTDALHSLMHPRISRAKPQDKRTQALLEFMRKREEVHPREVDRHFAHGSVKNYWGGSSRSTTHLLSAMHYRGLVRVARREGGVRLYSLNDRTPVDAGNDPAVQQARIDALVDIVVRKYAPLPGATLSAVVSRLRYAAPQWQGLLRDALRRARERLSQVRVDGIEWYWPAGEQIATEPPPEVVRLLTPFDPLVWDRRRFELFWGWAYRFEAYTPPAKRQLGYYALPMLWRDHVIGWANASVVNGKLQCECGYVGANPRERGFRGELAAEVKRLSDFLNIAKRR